MRIWLQAGHPHPRPLRRRNTARRIFLQKCLLAKCARLRNAPCGATLSTSPKHIRPRRRPHQRGPNANLDELKNVTARVSHRTPLPREGGGVPQGPRRPRFSFFRCDCQTADAASDPPRPGKRPRQAKARKSAKSSSKTRRKRRKRSPPRLSLTRCEDDQCGPERRIPRPPPEDDAAANSRLIWPQIPTCQPGRPCNSAPKREKQPSQSTISPCNSGLCARFIPIIPNGSGTD